AQMRHGQKQSAIADQPMTTFAQLALAPIVAEFTTALSSPERSAEHLHELRVAGKHLRYALELLEGALPSRLRASLLAQLEKLQEVLGDLNDMATAEVLVGDLAASTDERSVKRWLKA